MSVNKDSGLSEELLVYMRQNNPTSDELEGIRRETENMEYAYWQVPPEQALLMGQIAGWMGVRQAFEVGTYTGYSALAVASCMPEDGRLVACDIDFGPFEEVGRKYVRQAGVEHILELREGDAKVTLQQLLDEDGAGEYDLGFVDGHKPDYPDYYRKGIRLLRKGGALIVDNVFGLGGHIVDYDNLPEGELRDKVQGIHEVTEMIRQDHEEGRIQMSMLPISDGVTFVRKLRD